MKKLLTILLALLVVTGVVFADDPGSDVPPEYSASIVPTDSTLTLTSAVEGVFKHGFARDVTEGVYGSYSRNVFVTGLKSDGTNADAQDIGQYYIETNATTIVDVTFTVNAMENTTLGNYFVGYLFSYSKNTDNSSTVNRFTVDGSSIELIGAGEGGVDLNSNSSKVITSTADGGYGKLVLDLTATFPVNENLPEGVYSGTIKAAITVI